MIQIQLTPEDAVAVRDWLTGRLTYDEPINRLFNALNRALAAPAAKCHGCNGRPCPVVCPYA